MNPSGYSLRRRAKNVRTQLQAEDDVLVKVVSSGLCGSDIPRIFAQGASIILLR